MEKYRKHSRRENEDSIQFGYTERVGARTARRSTQHVDDVLTALLRRKGEGHRTATAGKNHGSRAEGENLKRPP